MTLLIDIASLLLAALGGAGAMGLVLWLRSAPSAAPSTVEDDAHFARETLSRLQELTKQVAEEVDQHGECVEEINAKLAKNDDNDEATVLAAVAQLIEANDRMQRQARFGRGAAAGPGAANRIACGRSPHRRADASRQPAGPR